VVNPQQLKEDLLIKQGVNFVIQTLANIFTKEMTACTQLLAQGETPKERLFKISTSSEESVRYIRADKLVNTYASQDFHQKLDAIDKSSKEYYLLNAIYLKAIDALYESKNIMLKACLSICGPQDKGEDAFMYADLLRAVCYRGAQEVMKRL
jgi:hypothetical protein